MLRFTLLSRTVRIEERILGLELLQSARGILDGSRLAEIATEIRSSGDYEPRDEDYTVSVQAHNLYEMDFMFLTLGWQVLNKECFSMQCGPDAVTIYVYQFESETTCRLALCFVEGLIWGEEGPSRLHPELVLRNKDAIVVLSGTSPKAFKRYF